MLLCENVNIEVKTSRRHTVLIAEYMEDTGMAKTLIAFFSRADENYYGGAMRYVKVGNTEMKAPYSPVYMTS